jgi:hypothetical protein
MEKVFLSYTYRPHPDHEASLDRLHRYVVRTIEAMGLFIVDGTVVGGRPLDDALRQRITDADALIALVTPQADDDGRVADPAFVLSEFHFAEGRQKPTMRVLHHELVARGLGAGNEYTSYKPGNELDVILKLMSTIGLWSREHGRKALVRIEPQNAVKQYNQARGDYCECQVITANGIFRNFERVNLYPEPGAVYAILPKICKGDRVILRLSNGGKGWEAPDAIDPFVGGILLEEMQVNEVRV